MLKNKISKIPHFAFSPERLFDKECLIRISRILTRPLRSRWAGTFRVSNIILGVLCGYILSCEVPTEVYDNPLDEEEAAQEGIEIPALVFFPDKVEIALGSSFTIRVFALQVQKLAGTHIIVNYDPNKLLLVSINPGDFFADIQDPVFFTEQNNATGKIDIYSSYLGSDSVSVSGTGGLASLVFTTTASGESIINYDSSSECVDPDDVPITINGFGVGLINAQ